MESKVIKLRITQAFTPGVKGLKFIFSDTFSLLLYMGKCNKISFSVLLVLTEGLGIFDG